MFCICIYRVEIRIKHFRLNTDPFQKIRFSRKIPAEKIITNNYYLCLLKDVQDIGKAFFSQKRTFTTSKR